MSFLQMPNPIAARRIFLGQSGLMLSGAAVALLAGKPALAARAGAATVNDAQILNTALGAELEAIAAYQLGAESKLLQKPVLDLALTFQGHHKEHADVLAKTVEKLLIGQREQIGERELGRSLPCRREGASARRAGRQAIVAPVDPPTHMGADPLRHRAWGLQPRRETPACIEFEVP